MAAWTVPVIGGTAQTAAVAPAGELPVFHRGGEQITVTYRLPSFVYADVYAGTHAGEAVAYIGGREAGRAELVYTQDVPREEPPEPTLWERIWQVLD